MRLKKTVFYLIFVFCALPEILMAKTISSQELQVWLNDFTRKSFAQSLLDNQPDSSDFQKKDFWLSMEWKRHPSSQEFVSRQCVQAAKQLFDQCEKRYSQKPVIPKLIHFIWVGSTISDRSKAIIGSWAKFHPDWEIKVWTDDDVQDFPWSSSRSFNIYKNAESFAEKANVLRCEILYRYGGIYSDVDVICLKSFEPLIHFDVDCFAGFAMNIPRQKKKHCYYPYLWMCNALIGAKQNSSVMKYCIDHFSSRKEGINSQIFRTGAALFSLACYEAMISKQTDVLLLPCSYFYALPLPTHRNNQDSLSSFVSEESFALHLWDFSWFGSKQ